jgi:LSD1 subclass zinc finger protein
MSVKTILCTKCRASLNVPAGMQTIRCSACGNVFAAAAAANAAAAEREEALLRDAAGPIEDASDESKDDNSTMLFVAVGGALAVVALLCFVGVWMLASGDNSAKVADEDLKPVLREATAEELAALRIANIPEEQRRRIYDDIRASARTTTERALMVPGSNVRAKLEDMLDATHENTIRQLAALHDITVEQVRDIVVEGDVKNWDPRARSRAYRDGERVYSDERAQGYQEKSPLRQ